MDVLLYMIHRVSMLIVSNDTELSGHSCVRPSQGDQPDMEVVIVEEQATYENITHVSCAIPVGEESLVCVVIPIRWPGVEYNATIMKRQNL